MEWGTFTASVIGGLIAGSVGWYKAWSINRKNKDDSFRKLAKTYKDELEICKKEREDLRTQVDALVVRVTELERKVLIRSGMAVIAADQDGIIREWSPNATVIFHYLSEEMLGKSLVTIVPPEWKDTHLKSFARAIETGVLARRGEPITVPALTKEGAHITIEVSLGGYIDPLSKRWVFIAKVYEL